MNTPVSPSAAATAWTTPEQPFRSPIITPSPAGGGYPETPDPIVSPGFSDAHADDVSASVAGSVLAAEARFAVHLADALPQGSTIGTIMDLPEVPCQHSKHTGGDDAGYPS